MRILASVAIVAMTAAAPAFAEETTVPNVPGDNGIDSALDGALHQPRRDREYERRQREERIREREERREDLRDERVLEDRREYTNELRERREQRRRELDQLREKRKERWEREEREERERRAR